MLPVSQEDSKYLYFFNFCNEDVTNYLEAKTSIQKVNSPLQTLLLLKKFVPTNTGKVEYQENNNSVRMLFSTVDETTTHFNLYILRQSYVKDLMQRQ